MAYLLSPGNFTRRPFFHSPGISLFFRILLSMLFRASISIPPPARIAAGWISSSSVVPKSIISREKHTASCLPGTRNLSLSGNFLKRKLCHKKWEMTLQDSFFLFLDTQHASKLFSCCFFQFIGRKSLLAFYTLAILSRHTYILRALPHSQSLNVWNRLQSRE